MPISLLKRKNTKIEIDKSGFDADNNSRNRSIQTKKKIYLSISIKTQSSLFLLIKSVILK